ncbi:ricin B lectin domain-containing protein [Penicillium viridicatum]|nr:ricin B lectin domain-containing protein [Penicillium viridicatum]
MSDFIGPNVYTVVTRLVDKRLDLDGGKKEDGTRLQLFKPYDNTQYGPNQRFVFAHVGNDEYLIINDRSGTYLTASDDNSQITGNVISPLEKRVRWKIEPVKDRSGSYFIYSVAFPKKVVDIKIATGIDDRSAVYTLPQDGAKNQQFFLRSA